MVKLLFRKGKFERTDRIINNQGNTGTRDAQQCRILVEEIFDEKLEGDSHDDNDNNNNNNNINSVDVNEDSRRIFVRGMRMRGQSS
jgi:hypothetical protein